MIMLTGSLPPLVNLKQIIFAKLYYIIRDLPASRYDFILIAGAYHDYSLFEYDWTGGLPLHC